MLYCPSDGGALVVPQRRERLRPIESYGAALKSLECIRLIKRLK